MENVRDTNLYFEIGILIDLIERNLNKCNSISFNVNLTLVNFLKGHK